MKIINFLTLTFILTAFLACNKTELTITDKIDEQTLVENIEDTSTNEDDEIKDGNIEDTPDDDSTEVNEENPEDTTNDESLEVSERLLKYLSECNYEESKQSDGYIDETERSIMKTCKENSFNNNKSELIANLMGEWELIGHGSGRILQKKPCVYLHVTKSQLTVGYKNDYLNTVETYNWKINEREILGELQFFLSTDQPILNGLILGGVVSENYMYSDATPVDGNMFLFQKIQ